MAQHSSDDDDLYTLVMMGLGSIGLIISAGVAVLLTAWSASVRWLLEHKVIVASHHHPLISLPHAGGAGLDYARCFVLAAIVLVLLFAAVQSVHRYWARNQELV